MTAIAQRSTEEILENQFESLRQHLRGRMRCEEDANDLAQEACLKMLQIPRTRKIQNPKGYLYKIAHNLVYQHYLDRVKRQSVDIDIDSLESGSSSIEEQIALNIRRMQIAHAMQELPPKCQTVLTLRWRDGLRIAEIAEHMMLSRGMVKKYLATGLLHFRKRLVHSSTRRLVAPP